MNYSEEKQKKKGKGEEQRDESVVEN